MDERDKIGGIDAETVSNLRGAVVAMLSSGGLAVEARMRYDKALETANRDRMAYNGAMDRLIDEVRALPLCPHDQARCPVDHIDDHGTPVLRRDAQAKLPATNLGLIWDIPDDVKPNTDDGSCHSGCPCYDSGSALPDPRRAICRYGSNCRITLVGLPCSRLADILLENTGILDQLREREEVTDEQA